MKSELVKQWRTFKGWSITRLVEEIHARTGKKIGEVTIKRWEGGHHEPHDTKLLLVAEALGIDYQTFLKGPDLYVSDPARLSNSPEILTEVYSYEGLQMTLPLSRWIGFSYPRISPRTPKDDSFILYIDKENPYIPFGRLVTCFIAEEPQDRDLVVIWNPEIGSHIQPFSALQNISPSTVIHGILIA